MPEVMNNGAPVSVKIDGEKHIVPSGYSEQSEEVLAHPLCTALTNERSAIMEPKGDNPNEMIQRMGYRLVVDGRVPTRKNPLRSPKLLDEDGEALGAPKGVPAVWHSRLDKGEDPKTDEEVAWRAAQAENQDGVDGQEDGQ